VLLLLDTTPGMAQSKIAEALGWASKYGPDKAKVNRALAALMKHRLADKDVRGKYSLTKKGKEDARRLRKAAVPGEFHVSTPTKKSETKRSQ
jgi:Mn-dependent DtxR family transcriptional regulator